MKTLYIECNMGAAGDMLMSALYEICGEKELFLTKMNEIFTPYHVTLSAAACAKCGIQGTHITVSIDGQEEGHAQEGHSGTGTAGEQEHSHHHNGEHKHKHHHTDYHSILNEIQSLDLPAQVKKDAAAIYQIIGEAEAHVHHTTLDQIHFHEVGSLDALADVVGCAFLIHLISPEQILCSPIHVGNGFVRCAHGILPVPAPATAEILKGIPYFTGSVTSELCTPTGAAVLKYFVSEFFSMPPMVPETIGYGMGSKDFPMANCVRIFFGELFKDTSATWSSDPEEGFPSDDSVLSISCNVDDMTGEALGLATEILTAAGALDVYTIPIQMKKNRPGILLTCICELEEQDKFTGLFFLHTSTRGVRYQIFERAKLESTFETRTSAYGAIRIKKSCGYGIEKEKPEFEDLKSVVMKNKCSLSLDDVTKSLH